MTSCENIIYCKVFLTLFGFPDTPDPFSALVDFSHIFVICDEAPPPLVYGFPYTVVLSIRANRWNFSILYHQNFGTALAIYLTRKRHAQPEH